MCQMMMTVHVQLNKLWMLEPVHILIWWECNMVRYCTNVVFRYFSSWKWGKYYTRGNASPYSTPTNVEIDFYVHYNIKLVTLSGTVSCLMKNSKDYFKLCIKFVNSTVVVRYFSKTKLQEANHINRKFSLPGKITIDPKRTKAHLEYCGHGREIFS